MVTSSCETNTSLFSTFVASTTMYRQDFVMYVSKNVYGLTHFLTLQTGKVLWQKLNQYWQTYVYNQHFEMLFFVTTFLMEGTVQSHQRPCFSSAGSPSLFTVKILQCILMPVMLQLSLFIPKKNNIIYSFLENWTNEKECGSRYFHSISVISVDM